MNKPLSIRKPLAQSFSILTFAIGCNAITAHAADQLETVIVTASKVKQDIQQTAVSMEALSGETLSNSGVSGVADIANFTPGLQLSEPAGGLTATVRIRGIGTPGLSVLDPSVPIFIDGVAQARTGSGFQDLLDISRIEILRGPQGTLYGRNSTAGAINVWTKDANTHKWEGSLQTQVGNYNDRELKGTINIPIADDLLAARISAFTVKQDGYVTNEYTGATGNGYADREGARAKIVLTPDDNLSIQWLNDYSKSISHPLSTWALLPDAFNPYAAGGIVSQPNLSGIPTNSFGFPITGTYSGKTYNDINSWALDKNFATSVTVNWDITDGFLAGDSLTSITAYSLYKTDTLYDADRSLLDYYQNGGPTSTNSWSQELRLASAAGEKWEYLGGLYYYAERLRADQTVDSDRIDTVAALQRGLLGPNGQALNVETNNWTNGDNAAVFGQATYNFSSKFSVTAGLRESWTQRRENNHLVIHSGWADQGGVLIEVPPDLVNFDIVDHQTIVETDTSGVLKGRYFFDDNIMFYASYDRGFKPGGFNILAGATGNSPTTYHKEISNNYEMGAKTQWFENHLQANVALFYMEFNGYHNQGAQTNGNLIVENIDKVTTDGVELDLQAIAAPGLTVGVGAAYLNPRVRSDDSANLSQGELLNDVSQYSANLNTEYSHSLRDIPGEGFARVDWSYRSAYGLGDPRIGIDQGGYSLTNIRFGVRNFYEHWALTGWVKNIFDKEYVINSAGNAASTTDGVGVDMGAPRTYGATVQYDY